MKFWQEYGYMVIIGTIIVTVITIVVMIDSRNEEEHLRACKDIGGEYKVVDKQYSGKVMVDVYGCVK